MNKKVVPLFIFLGLLPFLTAVPTTEIVDTLSNDAGSLQPVVDVIRPLIIKASVLVGGIFGLYIILIVLRVYYERKTLKTLQQIRYDFDQWNQNQGVPSSRERKSWLHKAIIDRIFPGHVRHHQYSLLSPEHNIKRGRKS